MAGLAIVGIGPRGVSVLERVVANLPPMLATCDEVAEPITIHLVDPFSPGAGRIWRFDQSPLLRMNSLAMDTTLFLDPSVTCHGPIVQGPSMAEWAASSATDALSTPELVAEAKTLAPTHFATRRLGGEYMQWCFGRAIERISGAARVVVHAASAVAIDDLDDGTVRVVLDGGHESFITDAAILTLGHLDAEPAGEFAAMVEHARRHGLAYLAPGHASDVSLDVFLPGADVIVRGFGLDFVDKLVLMTGGRGGTFVEVDDGSLRYAPSGLEPVFHVGSRRGVPYRSKLDYDLVGTRARHPRFFTPEAIAAIIATHDPLLFRAHAWPLIAKEVAWGYYHQLFQGHPQRVSMSWAEFDSAMEPLEWCGDAMNALIARSVTAVEDRIDFEALDRPLAGLWFGDDADMQAHIRAHIAADVHRRTEQHFSADLGAFNAFLAVLGLLPRILGAPTMSARSRVEEFDHWWFGFFSYFASGPPPRRLHELLALVDAGLVTFLGAEMWMTWDEDGFLAGSTSTERVVHARAALDARIPDPTLRHSRSALVRSLAARGSVTEQVLRDDDGTEFELGQIKVSSRDQRVVRSDGSAHPAIFALGPHSTSRAPAFARRGSNSVALRHNDIAARSAVQRMIDRIANTTPQ